MPTELDNTQKVFAAYRVRLADGSYIHTKTLHTAALLTAQRRATGYRRVLVTRLQYEMCSD